MRPDQWSIEGVIQEKVLLILSRNGRIWSFRAHTSPPIAEFLLSPESKLYPSNFGPQIWFRPITPRVPRVAYVTSMQPPDILSYRSSASLEFRALQMSPTFHFFDVHAWCCLYFFVVPSRDPLLILSALSYLPSSILALPNPKMSPTFHFFDAHIWSYLHVFGLLSRGLTTLTWLS